MTDSELVLFELTSLPDVWQMEKLIPDQLHKTDRLTIASLLLPCCYDDRRQDQRESQWFQCSQENLTHCFLNNTFHDTVQSVFTFLTELAEKCKVKIHTFIVIKQSQEKPVSLLGGEKREMFKWLHLVAIWYKQNTILSSQGIKYMWETSFNTFDTFFPKILWWI